MKKRKKYKSYRGVSPKLKSVCDLKSVVDRFWEKVLKSSGCWEWQASIDNMGYGRFNEQNNSFTAHRASWEFTNGKIAGGLWVLHKCDNRKCVRPDHLFLGTPLENIDDMVRKQRHYRGPHPWKSPLNEEQVLAIRKLREKGEQLKTIGNKFGISEAAVSDIYKRKTWAHVE
ncbi:MAG: HNH endonuclease signature motif containing protein [Hyphomicrobium sp.]|jgi:hypothetical protein